MKVDHKLKFILIKDSPFGEKLPRILPEK